MSLENCCEELKALGHKDLVIALSLGPSSDPDVNDVITNLVDDFLGRLLKTHLVRELVKDANIQAKDNNLKCDLSEKTEGPVLSAIEKALTDYLGMHIK